MPPLRAGSLWLYVHPVVALVGIGLLLYAASLGLATRQRRRDKAALLGRHARLGPYAYALMVLSWVLGLGSAWWGRSDLELAGSGHFKAGCYLVLLLSATALLSRWMDRMPGGRTIHPLLGAAAALLAGFQIFLGLQLMPK